MEPIRIATYAAALRPALLPAAFAPRPGRLTWLPAHLGVVAAATAVIVHGWGGWGVALALAFVVGHSVAGMAFVAHETLHGQTVRGRRARLAVGWLAFLPFVVSPRLWTVWHNQVHHGHTKHPDLDPDAYPGIAVWRRSRAVRVLDQLSLGRGHVAGLASLVLGFTTQSLHGLFSVGGDRRYMSRREQGLAIAETVAGVAVWAALGVAVGPRAMLFAFVIPLLVANAVVMAYILTNHGLSPSTEVNDPLLSSLSVTTPRVLQVLHLNFGYHVEHHVFPRMSAAHAPTVSRLLRARWPERYQSLPLWRALWLLCRTARIHLDPTTLVDPRSGRTWPTLQPRAAARDGDRTPRSPAAPFLVPSAGWPLTPRP